MPNKTGNVDASKRRKMAREATRLKIDGTRCLNQLDEIYDEASGESPNVQALRLRADIVLAKLKKVLPDVKAVELTGGLDDDGNDKPVKAIVFGRVDDPASEDTG